MILKADAIAKNREHKCQHCLRQTDQLCAGCSWRVCPQHSWTEVTRVDGGVYMRELCWTCRDGVLAK